MDSFYLLLIFVLLVATAFFVAAEFAFVRVRKSRIDHLVEEGNKNALIVRKIINHLDDYLSACQLGITITSLGLGWVGEPSIKAMLHPLFEKGLPESVASPLSFAISFSTITFLHVVLGELAPKSMAIQKAEQVSLFLARPMAIFHKIMYPFIWVLNGAAIWFIRLFGFKPANEHEEVHSEEELLIILSDSLKSGEINQSEYKYVSNIFKFDEKTAKEIMIPRLDMSVLNLEDTLEQNIEIMEKEQYTRFPVIVGDKDHIAGMIHAKEFFMQLNKNPDLNLESLVRPVIRVIETTPVKTLLNTMQKKGVHFIILVDEFGGTSGLVTLENVLEEIVGEIRDEFDTDEKPTYTVVNSNELIVEGKVLITKVNELLNCELDHSVVDTVGGLISTYNNSFKKGESLELEDITFTIMEEENSRYLKVRVSKREIQ